MKFKIPNKLSQNNYHVLRKIGYFPIHDRLSNQDSFVRKLSSGHYPRFHLYVYQKQDDLVFDLHLDQNINRYQGQTAHNADYESHEVKNELARIYQEIKTYLT